MPRGRGRGRRRLRRGKDLGHPRRPRVGNVGSSWAPDRGFNLEVEPCGIDNLIVGDLTPRQARTLASRLLEVADRIEELQADDVRDAARAISSQKGGGTITDLARAADRLGVQVTTMYTAWEVEHDARQ